MLDACTIRRRGPVTTDPATGVVTPSWTPVYSGPCKIQDSKGFGAAGTAPQSGEHRFTVQGWQLHLPVAATGPTVGDVVTVTAAAVDPALVGRTYHLGNVFAKTYPTAGRFQLEEVVS